MPIVIIMPDWFLKAHEAYFCHLLQYPTVSISVGGRLIRGARVQCAWMIEDCVQLLSALVSSRQTLLVDVQVLPTGLGLRPPQRVMRGITIVVLHISVTADALAFSRHLGQPQAGALVLLLGDPGIFHGAVFVHQV